MSPPSLEELLGLYSRLRREVADARTSYPRQERRIERLLVEIAGVERRLLNLQPLDEQTNDMLPGVM